MCLSRNNSGDHTFPGSESGSSGEQLNTDHPSADQFRMLLNLLPPQSLAQVGDLDSIR